MENKYQKNLNTFCEKYCFKYQDCKNKNCSVRKNMQEAINKLYEYEKYIPNVNELKDWCKGDYLQTEGAKLKEKLNNHKYRGG